MVLEELIDGFIFDNKKIECISFLDRKNVTEWLKIISGFANTYGGTLYIGVEHDSNKLIGFSKNNADNEINYIKNQISEYLEPSPKIKIRLLSFKSTDTKRYIIEVTILESEIKPVIVQYNGMQGFYVRHGDVTTPATSEEISDMFVFYYGKYQSKKQEIINDKDCSLKRFLENTENFANVVNAIIFNGEPIIKQEDLSPSFTDNQYENYKKINEYGPEFKENNHDLVKIWSLMNQKITIACINTENQETLNKYILPKILRYDAVNLEKQIETNSGPITKPITIVIYTGKSNWNAPTSLYELCDTENKLNQIDEKYRETAKKMLFNNYHYILFDINKLDENTLRHFEGDPYLVFEYFLHYANNKGTIKNRVELQEALKIDQVIKNPEITLAVMDAFSDSTNKPFKEAFNNCKKKNKENITMCDVVVELEKLAVDRETPIIEAKVEAKYDAQLKEKDEVIKEKDVEIKEKDGVIKETKEALEVSLKENALLKAQLEKIKKSNSSK